MVGDHMGIPRTVVFVAAIVSFFWSLLLSDWRAGGHEVLLLWAR
jgi:hypothetical protein